jgi:gliding motility-associated-like protein
MRAIVFFTVFLLVSVCVFSARGQTCSGSLGAPVVNYTFGAGTTFGVGSALPARVTNMPFVNNSCGGNDNSYTIETDLPGTCKGGTWLPISHDHTGDKYGYMMIINASLEPSIFFTETVKGTTLCPNTTYFFGAWIANILKDEPATKGFIRPNVTFNLKTPDGKILKSLNTGDIPAQADVAWVQYGALFTSPADGSDVIIEMVNNASGGNGNDLALDDITFSPCGPLIQTGFSSVTDTAARKHCANDNFSYTLLSAQSGYLSPSYQWQINQNDGNGWVNIPGATAPSLTVNFTNAAAAAYQYRVGLLNSTQAGSESCRIYSAPLTIHVYAPTSFVLPAVTSGCIGFPLQFGSTDGDSFEWTGPNNFMSTMNSPTVSYSATAADEGVYTLKILKNNCPSFQTTTVKLFAAPSVTSTGDVTICRGEATTLGVETTNVTHYKWTPSTGLDHDDVASPVATPGTTTRYTVTVSNDGCTAVMPSASITVNVLALPVAGAGTELKLFEGQSATLGGKATGDSIITYWTPSTYLNNASLLNPVTTPLNNITYTLHVQSLAGCGESTSSVFVRVYKKLGIPNTFTPNNDGVNDLWNINNIDTYPNATVTVFNRYGQQVYFSHGYPKPWNGTSNNKPLPVGTYYYLIDPKEDKVPVVSGWLLMMR